MYRIIINRPMLAIGMKQIAQPQLQMTRRPQCLFKKVVTKVKTKQGLRKRSPQVTMVTQVNQD